MRYLVEAAVQLPWATWLPGPVPADSGRAAQLMLAAVVECEPVERALACTIEDARVEAVAVVQDRGLLAEEASWLGQSLVGQSFEAPFREGELRGTPDLELRLDADANSLLEDLLGRAMLGLELPEARVQRESELGVILGARGASAVDVVHELDPTSIHSAAQGSLRTSSGEVWSLQGSSSAVLDGDGLVERRWWAMAQPSASSVSELAYLQGGLARRLEPGENPLAQRPPSGEVLGLQGMSWTMARSAVWTPDLALDTGRAWPEWGLSVRATGLADRRLDHSLAGGAELWLQLDTPLGLGADLGAAWHDGREHTLFPTPFPVSEREALVGFHYRPREDLWAPRLGLSWALSQRRYAYATPESVWIPMLSAELGLERRFERLAVGAFARGRMDAAPTLLRLMGRTEQPDTISLQAGLQVRWEVLTWD